MDGCPLPYEFEKKEKEPGERLYWIAFKEREIAAVIEGLRQDEVKKKELEGRRRSARRRRRGESMILIATRMVVAHTRSAHLALGSTNHREDPSSLIRKSSLTKKSLTRKFLIKFLVRKLLIRKFLIKFLIGKFLIRKFRASLGKVLVIPVMKLSFFKEKMACS